MEFIKIAYCVTVPLLLSYAWFSRGSNKDRAINLLAVTNLLLIGNTVFMTRQFWGFYQLSLYLPAPPPVSFQPNIVSTVQLLLVFLLPLFSLIRNFRKSSWFSLLVWAAVYSFFPYSTWNFYDLETKIMMYLCMVCVVYALLWLCNRLPYQSEPR